MTLDKDTTKAAVERVAHAIGRRTDNENFKEYLRFLHVELVEHGIDGWMDGKIARGQLGDAARSLVARIESTAGSARHLPTTGDWLKACGEAGRATHRYDQPLEPPVENQVQVTCPFCGEADRVWTNSEPPRSAGYRCSRCSALFSGEDGEWERCARLRERQRAFCVGHPDPDIAISLSDSEAAAL